MRTSNYIAYSPEFEDTDGVRKVIAFSTRTSRRVVLLTREAMSLKSSSLNELSEATKLSLTESKAIIPDGENELETIIRENVRASEENETLFIVIQPSATCQLGCDYCGQHHTRGLLSEKHSDAIINRISAKLSTKKYQNLEIGWFGAEPLNAISKIKYIGSRVVELAKSAGVKLKGRLITNGMRLTSEQVELLKKVGVEWVEVTIDGDQEAHDARRGTKSGNGSYNRIVANIIDFKNKAGDDIKLIIRCNVDERNVNSVPELIQEVCQGRLSGLVDEFYCAPIHNWGNNAENQSLSLDRYASQEIRWFIDIANRGVKTPLIPKRVNIPCMVFQPDAELYDAFGGIFNCTEVSYVPTYQVLDKDSGSAKNKYAIGHLDDGDEKKLTAPFIDFFSRVAAGDFPCHSCFLFPVCGGTCAKSWEQGFAACPPVKRNLPQRLLLQHFYDRGATISVPSL